MKTLSIIVAFVALTLVSFSGDTLAQDNPQPKSVKQPNPSTTATEDLSQIIRGSVTMSSTGIQMFTNSQEETFPVTLRDIGSYEIKTKLGIGRFAAIVDTYKKAGINIQFVNKKELETTMTLLEFRIPDGQSMKTSEILFLLDRCNFRPATICEALSLDEVEEKVSDLNLKVCVFGTLGTSVGGKNLVFGVQYPLKGSADRKGAGFEQYLKSDNLWQGSMIIPALLEISY